MKDGLAKVTAGAALAAAFIGFTIACSSCGALVPEERAIKAAEDMGFRDVRVIDHVWWWVPLRGCGESDAAMFLVSGVNPAGKRVDLTVCSGYPFKGATIRAQ